MLDLSNISPSPGSRKKGRKRVGRGPGSGNGKTSGKGHKGQKARSGYSRRLGFEGGQMPLMRRLPKRGFHHEARHPYAEVNLYLLESHFEAGEEVTPERVWEKGLAKKRAGGVKILGDGDLTKALKLKVNAITGSAREKIEKVGGSVEMIEVPVARAVKPPRPSKTTK